METQVEHRNLKDCAHCRINPQAAKPFLKMIRVRIEDPVYSDLQETAKRHHQPADCFVCEGIQEFLDALPRKPKD